jgi:ferredoxin like protein
VAVTEEKPVSLEEALAANVWDVDYEPHIEVDEDECKRCESKICVYLCPAGCYTLFGEKVLVSYEGCLECGTCRVVCPRSAVRWSYPKSGRGVHYRYG